MRKINLLQITHDLRIGGLQEVVVNICRKINRDQYNVKVLCLREKGDLASRIEELGIEVLCLPTKDKTVDYFSFIKVAKIIKDYSIDIIHTHNTQPFFDGTLGAVIAGKKVIIHTDHARTFPDKKRYMFAEWVMSYFAYKVVGVSKHTCDNLQKFEFISEKKLQVIENGIDESVYQINLDRLEKRREFNINENTLIVGLGVRLVEQKGISFLLDALALLVNDNLDLKLLIAGEGEKKSELENKASLLGLDDNVVFLGPRLDMAELLKIFDIYVLPSFWEGLPMVLLEAMASGLPVVATDVGGVNGAIYDGVNGFLVQPRDSEALYSAIKLLLEKPDMRKKFALAGQKIFAEKFSAGEMVKKYELLYKAGLKKKGNL